jgi:hypothetical protein
MGTGYRQIAASYSAILVSSGRPGESQNTQSLRGLTFSLPVPKIIKIAKKTEQDRQ